MEKTDFRQLINELVDSGYSLELLAHECECGSAYLRQLMNGKRKTPNYDLGRRLVELHEQMGEGE